MKSLKMSAWVLLALMGLGLVLTDPAKAKPDRGNGHGNGNRPAPIEDVEDAELDSETTNLLDGDRINILRDMLQGDDDYEDLISNNLRLEILDDLDSLPPGIQRRLERGRGLPPGIAKKYQMPISVLSVLDLAPDTELLIIGDNVVVVNPSDIILDIFEGIL